MYEYQFLEILNHFFVFTIKMCGGGGELNLIPLEQLIHIEDVVNRRSSNTQPSSTNNYNNSNNNNSSNNNYSGSGT